MQIRCSYVNINIVIRGQNEIAFFMKRIETPTVSPEPKL